MPEPMTPRLEIASRLLAGAAISTVYPAAPDLVRAHVGIALAFADELIRQVGLECDRCGWRPSRPVGLAWSNTPETVADTERFLAEHVGSCPAREARA